MLTIKDIWKRNSYDKADSTYDLLVGHDGDWDTDGDKEEKYFAELINIFNTIESEYVVDIKGGYAKVDYVKMINELNIKEFFIKEKVLNEHMYEDGNETYLEYEMVQYLMHINSGNTGIKTTKKLISFVIWEWNLLKNKKENRNEKNII